MGNQRLSKSESSYISWYRRVHPRSTARLASQIFDGLQPGTRAGLEAGIYSSSAQSAACRGLTEAHRLDQRKPLHMLVHIFGYLLELEREREERRAAVALARMPRADRFRIATRSRWEALRELTV